MAAVASTSITKQPFKNSAGKMFDHMLASVVMDDISQPNPVSAPKPARKNFFGAGNFGMSTAMISHVTSAPPSPNA